VLIIKDEYLFGRRVFIPVLNCCGTLLRFTEYRNGIDAHGAPFSYCTEICTRCGSLVECAEYIMSFNRFLRMIKQKRKNKVEVIVFPDTVKEIPSNIHHLIVLTPSIDLARPSPKLA